MTFGEGPLSTPLLVEAAETLFVPVAILNNVEGYDREILERYEEPTWNNPVVRYVDGKGRDLIPRKDRVWDLGGTTTRMVAALEKAGRDVPAWFSTLEEETSSGEVETAAFAMF